MQAMIVMKEVTVQNFWVVNKMIETKNNESAVLTQNVLFVFESML